MAQWVKHLLGMQEDVTLILTTHSSKKAGVEVHAYNPSPGKENRK